LEDGVADLTSAFRVVAEFVVIAGLVHPAINKAFVVGQAFVWR
jgi:hypothetical protein